MQQKTYDFLVHLRVPMLSFGGDLMGDAVEIAIRKLQTHEFISLAEIECALANKFHCSPGAADRRLRRAIEVTEFRSGEYPNPELEKLRVQYQVDTWSVKKFIYAAARSLMENE